jgi:hypothetical protein
MTRQKGDYVYMTTKQNGEHHVAIPQHKPVKVGTLASIFNSVASHLDMPREELLETMKL